MSRSLGNIIGDSLQLCMGYAQQLLAGVPAEKFGRFARVGGHVIESNHPAFLLGHLSLYASRIVEQLGQDATAITPSEQYQQLFSKDACCQDDVNGTIYPPMEEIVSTFMSGYEKALEVLRAAPDEAFAQPNPAGGRMTEWFPTIGSMHAFYCGGHMMMHLGQMSAWRRMVGLGPA